MTNANDLEISVFGSKAEQITEGQHFVATITSVEGRKVVKLTPTHVIGHIGKDWIPSGFDQRGAKKY